MRAKALSALAAALLLLAAAAVVQAEKQDVVFRNIKNKTIYLGCVKNKGKLDKIPTYFCFDGNDNKQYISPGAEWEEINAEKVCFQHEDGRIRACHELSKPSSAKKSYACFDASKQLSPFTPEKGWKRFSDSDKRCDDEQKRFNVPRNMTMPSLNLE